MWKNRIGWVIWLIATAILYFFENNSGTRTLLITSVLIPLLSMVCAAIAARRVAVSFAAPESCKKGEQAPIDVKINGSRALIGASLVCQISVCNQLTGEKTSSTLAVNGSQKKNFSLAVSHCGSIALSTEKVFVQDWFGLVHFAAAACEPEYITVFPTLRPLQISMVESLTVTGEGDRWSSTRPGSDPSETFAIREYIPGDPIRQIHWKLSQKTGTLMVRELGLPVTEETLLLLETSCRTEPDADAMDEAMELVLSVSRALMAEGISHKVCWKNRLLNEPEIFEVHTEKEFAALRLRILTASAAVDDESVGGCFRRWYGDEVYAHTVIVTPHPDTNAITLVGDNRVTMLIVGNAGEVYAAGDIHTVNVTRDTTCLEL